MDNKITQLAQHIWDSLGPGYSESVYHCAFEVGLRNLQLYYETERIIPVFYEGQNVGNVRADLIVNKKLVIELKSVGKLNEQYRIQTKNYLTLLDLEDAYLINFPDKVGAVEIEYIHMPKCPPLAAPLDLIDC